jgi:hypothetical protein
MRQLRTESRVVEFVDVLYAFLSIMYLANNDVAPEQIPSFIVCIIARLSSGDGFGRLNLTNGARVCDPQRLRDRNTRWNNRQRLVWRMLRLTEPRSADPRQISPCPAPPPFAIEVGSCYVVTRHT